MPEFWGPAVVIFLKHRWRYFRTILFLAPLMSLPATPSPTRSPEVDPPILPSHSFTSNDGLTAAERAELELDELMRDSSPSPDGQDSFRGDNTTSSNFLSPLTGAAGGQAPGALTGISHRNVAAAADRLATRHKLNPYQKKMVDDFVQVSLASAHSEWLTHY